MRHSRHATGLSAAGSAAQGGGGDGGAGVAVLERRSAPSEIRVLVEAPPLPEAELRKAWSVAY